MEKLNNNNNNRSQFCRNHDDDVSTSHDSISCVKEGKLPYHLRIMGKHNSRETLDYLLNYVTEAQINKNDKRPALNLGSSQF